MINQPQGASLMTTPWSVGDRVRIRTPIEIYPIAIFPAGLTGTVSHVFETETYTITAHVRLDEPHPALDGWDNELQVWHDANRDGADCTMDKFERIQETSWTPVIIRPEISALMEKLGYHPSHTGGNCWTWEKVGPTSYAWISTEDNELTADPAAPVWVIGRYRNDDGLDQTGWINVTRLTLDQAVEHIERLPTPERGQEVIIDGLDALLHAYPAN